MSEDRPHERGRRGRDDRRDRRQGRPDRQQHRRDRQQERRDRPHDRGAPPEGGRKWRTSEPGRPRQPRADEPRRSRADEPRRSRADEPRRPRADEPRRPRADEPRRPRADEPRRSRADEPRRPRADEYGREPGHREPGPRERGTETEPAHPDRGGDTGRAVPEPPADAHPEDLDRAVRDELRSLPRPTADLVARHLVAAGRMLDDDPEGALSHALAARGLAARVAAVREAVGIAAYHAGQWHTAITELRTYQRMSGHPTHLAVVADCERALGRPEKAVDLYRSAPRDRLTTEEAVELLIVAAGARTDLGQVAAAVAMLQVPELTADGPWAARLRYAYADALLAAGRAVEAREWFSRAAEADELATTDAADRLLELDGVVMPEEEDETADPEDDPPADAAGHGPAYQAEEAAAGAAAHAHPAPAGGPPRLVDRYDALVLDLDGVVYVGEEPVPGAAATIARLRDDGVRILFATNNASRDQRSVADLLTRVGVPADPEEVLTSAMVAADELAGRLPAGAPVLVVGAPALAAEVERAGLHPVRSADEAPAAVVQGYAADVAWRDLAEACVAVRAGATWVATNLDPTLPSARGPLPGNGALVAAVQAALGRGPDLVAGKPEPAFFRFAARRAGSRRSLVVGDRLETDVAGARQAGLDSLLVLTGIATATQARTAPEGQRPTYVAADLTGLLSPASPG